MSEIADNVQKNEPVEYLSLLPMIRMKIVNYLGPDDRCRYQICSKTCRAEVKSSTNHIYSLWFRFYDKDEAMIDIQFGDPKNGPTGFTMKFVNEFGYIYMIYRTRGKQLWWKLVGGSNENARQKLGDFAFQYFKDLLLIHQKGIKYLWIDCGWEDFVMDFDSRISHLKNLKELKLRGNFDYIQFVSTVSSSLDTLKIYRNQHHPTPIKQAFEVENRVVCVDYSLTYEQFLRFNVPIINVGIGQLTVKDVFNYIQSWLNGSMKNKVKQVHWSLPIRSFDKVELVRMFDLPYLDEEEKRYTIKHHIDAKKHALLDIKIGSVNVKFSSTNTARALL